MILYSELIEKDVVDIKTGSNLGTVCDLEIDEECAVIESIIVCKNTGWWCFCFKVEKYIISWNCIKKIGEDVILVEVGEEKVPCERKKEGFFGKIFN